MLESSCREPVPFGGLWGKEREGGWREGGSLSVWEKKGGGGCGCDVMLDEKW